LFAFAREEPEPEQEQCGIGSENGKRQPAGWAFIITGTGNTRKENLSKIKYYQIKSCMPLYSFNIYLD